VLKKRDIINEWPLYPCPCFPRARFFPTHTFESAMENGWYEKENDFEDRDAIARITSDNEL